LTTHVSVIIPALNEAPNIVPAIDRAWQAGAQEVIVVDGGSADGTLEIAAACNCLAISAARGRAVQQNAGARRASGDVLLFLHADTWLVARAARQIVQAVHDPNVAGGSFRQRIEAPGFLYRLLERGNAVRAGWGRPYGDQGIFVRRDFFERVGGFPEVGLLEDLLLARQLRRLGRLVLLPGPLCVSARRWQRHGVVRQTLRNWGILAAAKLGASPDRLAGLYRPHE
jgi:rSAM/selenodomain-associated transferase 2